MVASVSICLIVKNEEKQLKRCLDSVRPYVKEICVVDTGSTDSTVEIARSFTEKVEIFTECNDDQGRIENFSQARQHSFELATQPWVMWIDGDDEVRGAENIEKIITQCAPPNGQPAYVMFPYEYSRDDKGNITCIHYRERLITPRRDFHWVDPVHEVLLPDRPGETIRHQRDDVVIVHRRDESGKIIEPGRNLRILKAHYAKTGESNVRQLYYLGLEYGYVGELDNAIKFHKRYVELSGWDDEKFLACIKISEHYNSLSKYDDAIEWGLKALTVREGWAEAYFSLSRSYYYLAQRGGLQEHRNWERSVHFAQLGLQLPPTKTMLFVNPVERDFDIHRYLNMALQKIGNISGALDSVNKALAVRPDDSNLLLNRKIYGEFLARQQIEQGLITLLGSGAITQQTRLSVIDVIHKKIVEEPPKSKTPSLIVAKKRPPLNIVFYVGWSCEPWTPKTMQQGGIGGSETAIVEVGKRLASMGHKVRVYGDCLHMEGRYDGVDYLHYNRCKDIRCDVFITSRRPHMMDDEHNIKAKISLCWVHDIHCGQSLTHVRALRIDKFLALSQWHRSLLLSTYKFVHPSQVITTRNGIDLHRFDVQIERNPHKAIYSSSPDRGLEVAIRNWPKVRESVPDAELHVFYGFKTWEIAANSSKDQGQLELISHLKMQLEENRKHGVVFKDRVNQVELAKEFLSAGVWAYPTWFSETSCITAMEAQAAGLRMVTSPIAALNETVGTRGVMISGDWLSEEYQDKWVGAVTEAMLKPDDEDRKLLQQYAKDNFGWDSLVSDWDEMLYSVLEEIKQNIIPPYKQVAS